MAGVSVLDVLKCQTRFRDIRQIGGDCFALANGSQEGLRLTRRLIDQRYEGPYPRDLLGNDAGSNTGFDLIQSRLYWETRCCEIFVDSSEKLHIDLEMLVFQNLQGILVPVPDYSAGSEGTQ